MTCSRSTEIGVEAWLLYITRRYLHTFKPDKHFSNTPEHNMTISNNISYNKGSIFYNISKLRKLRNKTEDDLLGRYAC
jgi:hypothetical protein